MILTRNVDLSVEAMMGLVAFVVADLLRLHVLPTPVAVIARNRCWGWSSG